MWERVRIEAWASPRSLFGSRLWREVSADTCGHFSKSRHSLVEGEIQWQQRNPARSIEAAMILLCATSGTAACWRNRAAFLSGLICLTVQHCDLIEPRARKKFLPSRSLRSTALWNPPSLARVSVSSNCPKPRASLRCLCRQEMRPIHQSPLHTSKSFGPRPFAVDRRSSPSIRG